MHFQVRTMVPAVLALAIGLTTACNAFAQAKPAAKATIRLDWKAGAQHAPFYYAKDKGYYTAEGIDLQIIPGSGSSDSVKQVGAKAVDFALAFVPREVQVRRSPPVVELGGNGNHPGFDPKCRWINSQEWTCK